MENDQNAPPADAPSQDALSSRDERRAEIYKQYEKLNSVESPVVDSPAPAPEDFKQADPVVVPAVKGGDSEADTSVKDQEVKDTNKTVPKAALDEERERRKQANLRLREVEARVKELETQLEAAAKPTDPDSSDETVKPYLQKISELESQLNSTKKKEEEMARQQALQTREARLRRMDKELQEVGFPGFYETLYHTSNAVQRRFHDGLLTQEQMEDESEWKKAYMEDVYPTVSDKFKGVAKEEKLNEKKAAKAKAGVIESHGKAPAVPEKSEKAPSMDDLRKSYFDMRRKNNPNIRKS